MDGFAIHNLKDMRTVSIADDVEVARPPRPPPTPVESDQVDYDDETKRLVEAAEAVRSAYEDINREVRDMERERDDLQKSIDTVRKYKQSRDLT